MKKHLFSLLGLSEERPNPALLTPNAMEHLAEELEEAISSSERVAIDELSSELLRLTSTFVRSLPTDIRAVVSGNAKHSSPHDSLYMIGQLSFAQHLAAVVASKRPHKEFTDLLNEKWTTPYLRALHRKNLSSSDLASEIGAAKETVSRNLRKLRDSGITDFKKRGSSVINFLTPPAKEIWAAIENNNSATKLDELRNTHSEIEDGTTNHHTTEKVHDLISRLKGGSISDHMKKMPTMDAPT